MLAKFWRPVPCDIWDRIADHDHLAQRLYLWLWTGPASQQCGLAILREYEAAGALRTKPVMIQQALRTLEADGLLTVQPAARGRSIVWLDRYLSGQTPVKPEHRLSVLSDIERHDAGNAVTQALEDWDIWDAASRLPVGRQGAARLHRTKQNKTEQNTGSASVDAPPPPEPAPKTDKPKRERTVAQNPPTREQTRAIFAELGGTQSDADNCHDWYDSRGWSSGKAPLKKWDVACRIWHRRTLERPQTGYNGKPARGQPTMVIDQAALERAAQEQRELLARMDAGLDDSPF